MFLVMVNYNIVLAYECIDASTLMSLNNKLLMVYDTKELFENS